MKTIWKFELETTDSQFIEMPVDTKILTIQTQFNTPCLWGLVEPENTKVKRQIRIVGTGHPIPDIHLGEYVGTYQLAGGLGIYHVFIK